jgi:putative transposase
MRDGRDKRGRKSGDGWISLSTLDRIYRSDDLLPAPSSLPDQTVLPWHPLAISLYARAAKPDLTAVAAQIAAMWHEGLGAKPPTVHQVAYFFRKKYSRGDQHHGRHTGSALRSKKFYQHRTAQGLPPFTEVHADGWTTHFTAPHPVDGGFVTYELWHAQDVATRYLTPMAIGLSESMDVIAKCVEECIRVGGVPALFQTDSTGSMKNKTMETDPVASLSARAGMTVVHPVAVGNSQANGIAENLNAWLDRESKALATYQGKSMDSLVFKRQGKLTRKMVAARSAGDLALAAQVKAELERLTKGIVFETREDAIAWIRAIEVKWNNRPHEALPKVRDAATGRQRHMTPQESLDAARAAGWQPVAMDEASLVDLFRVHVQRKVTRETVTAHSGQRYYHPELQHYDGEQVMVAIDRMEWAHVWVKDLEGRLLCKAEYVHATGYRALTMYEAALERRADAALKRLDDKAMDVQRRMAAPPLELEAPAVVLDLNAIVAQPRRRELEPQRLEPYELPAYVAQLTRERLAREAAAAAARQAGNEEDPEGDDFKEVAAG